MSTLLQQLNLDQVLGMQLDADRRRQGRFLRPKFVYIIGCLIDLAYAGMWLYAELSVYAMARRVAANEPLRAIVCLYGYCLIHKPVLHMIIHELYSGSLTYELWYGMTGTLLQGIYDFVNSLFCKVFFGSVSMWLAVMMLDLSAYVWYQLLMVHLYNRNSVLEVGVPDYNATGRYV